MDYEKAYKDALERAKKIYDSPNASSGRKEWLESTFPELAETESEDLGMINEIIHTVTGYHPIHTTEEIDSMVAYLEKQKESLHISEICKENADSFTDEDERIRKGLIQYISSLTWQRDYEFNKVLDKEKVLAWLEKQKPNIELIQRSWYMEGYHDREFSREPKWIIKPGKGGPKYEKNEKYGQPLEQKPAEWSEFEEEYIRLYKEGYADGKAGSWPISDNNLKEYAAELLALARKELQPEIDAEVVKAYKNADRMQYEKGREDALKDLPRWKKCAPCDEDKATIPAWIVRFDAELAGESAVVHHGHYILFGELEKLPKEE